MISEKYKNIRCFHIPECYLNPPSTQDDNTVFQLNIFFNIYKLFVLRKYWMCVYYYICNVVALMHKKTIWFDLILPFLRFQVTCCGLVSEVIHTVFHSWPRYDWFHSGCHIHIYYKPLYHFHWNFIFNLLKMYLILILLNYFSFI